ncbi:MAG: hypothetical protein QOG06_1092 [Gaiellaceae bacterium]|nr:hypothetical protein [Gaiellaceae bacterium]
MRSGPLLLALLLAGVIAFGSRPAPAHAAGVIVARPTTGGVYKYATPEAAPYVGTRAVVHSVTSGPAAPPLNDDDGTGYPDYVERVSKAADAALGYYADHGFKTPLPDTAGPDTKPDIYIDALPAGTFGVTFSEKSAEGGTFVLVSPRLDPTEPEALGGLRPTVAHELAHVIQFSYVVSGNLPRWAAEGSAVALSMLVSPDVRDLVASDYLDAWLSDPWLPLDDERFSCSHCYGGAWWWLYLDGLNRDVLPRYFSQLGADDQAGKPTRVGVSQLDSALRASHVGSLDATFAAFSVGLYRRGLPLGAPFALNATTKSRATSVISLSGLSTHYIPVRVPRKSRGVIIAVPYGKGPSPSVTMVVGGPKGRRVTGKRVRPGKGVVLSTAFRNTAERRSIVLIVSSGHLNGVRYQLGYAAVGAHGRLPGWIVF